MTQNEQAEAIRVRRTETINTLATLAAALSVTPDLPTPLELAQAARNTFSGYHNTLIEARIQVTFARILNALKVREDSN
jgi:hypothetical protein